MTLTLALDLTPNLSFTSDPASFYNKCAPPLRSGLYGRDEPPRVVYPSVFASRLAPGYGGGFSAVRSVVVMGFRGRGGGVGITVARDVRY